jgi:acetoin utilization deacetylase AcuC-like enzyme
MHPDTGRHDTGWGHPEHQGRLPAVVRALDRDTPALLHAVTPKEAAHAGEEDLLLVHTADHVRKVRTVCEAARERGAPVDISGDTVVSGSSWDAALAAAGCAIDAAASVASGASRSAFALCRPPGHHATANVAMGFCLFNNVAIAARTLQRDHGVDRVLIVDWDVHHGNGTQDIFREDGSVYYLPLHQHPWYPGTGSPSERGSGAGEGATRNVRIAAGTARIDYIQAYTDAVEATFGEFEPDVVLVSAGYDCLAGDPLGGLLLEPSDLHAMTRCVVERAATVAGGRVAAVLEGGYAPDRLGRGVVATIHALCGLDVPD